MDSIEKINRQLRFGLTIKKFLDANKAIMEENKKLGLEDSDLVTSFGGLFLTSGITKAMIVEIVNGKRNMSSTTLSAILEGLSITMTEFGQVYDSITEKHIIEYQKEIKKKKPV